MLMKKDRGIFPPCEDYVKETASGFHIKPTHWWKVRALWSGWCMGGYGLKLW